MPLFKFKHLSLSAQAWQMLTAHQERGYSPRRFLCVGCLVRNPTILIKRSLSWWCCRHKGSVTWPTQMALLVLSISKKQRKCHVIQFSAVEGEGWSSALKQHWAAVVWNHCERALYIHLPSISSTILLYSTDYPDSKSASECDLSASPRRRSKSMWFCTSVLKTHPTNPVSKILFMHVPSCDGCVYEILLIKSRN